MTVEVWFGGEGGIRALSGLLESVSYRNYLAAVAVNAAVAVAHCPPLTAGMPLVHVRGAPLESEREPRAVPFDARSTDGRTPHAALVSGESHSVTSPRLMRALRTPASSPPDTASCTSDAPATSSHDHAAWAAYTPPVSTADLSTAAAAAVHQRLSETERTVVPKRLARGRPPSPPLATAASRPLRRRVPNRRPPPQPLDCARPGRTVHSLFLGCTHHPRPSSRPTE